MRYLHPYDRDLLRKISSKDYHSKNFYDIMLQNHGIREGIYIWHDQKKITEKDCLPRYWILLPTS